MLTAINESQDKTPAFEVSKPEGRNTNWTCPLCRKPTIWVKPGVDGTMAHFRHKSAAEHPRLSEGKIHNKAKHLFLPKFQSKNPVRNSEIERVIDRESFQIADIYFEHAQHGPIAVEVQCSLQSVPAFKERTKKYTEQGISVLWLLNEETFLPEKKVDSGRTGVAFKDSVRWLQRQYYGRVYTFDPETLRIRPARLTSQSEIKENSYHGDYRYWYKTLADISYGQLPNYGLLTDTVNDNKIARFYDKCWWKTGDDKATAEVSV